MEEVTRIKNPSIGDLVDHQQHSKTGSAPDVEESCFSGQPDKDNTPQSALSHSDFPKQNLEDNKSSPE